MNKKTQNFNTYLVLILFSLLFLFPILWMVMTSLKSPVQAARFLSFPTDPQWGNYLEAWKTAGFGEAFINTFEIGIGTVLLSTFAGLPMAYSLVRYSVAGSALASKSMLVLLDTP